MAASAPAPATGGGWSEPPWSGWIATTGDALLMLEAARRGVIPRVTRRLVDAERKMITSGSVFVFDEDESGIKRWTDGLYWSPSRILGNFLLYRETDKRGAGHRRAERAPPQDPWEHDDSSLSRPKSDKQLSEKQRERSLVGSLTNSYKFKHDGLMKKTFSLTIGGVAQHLISYYKVEDVETGRLRSPSSIPELAALEISPEYLDKTHFRIPPKVEIGRDGRPHYVGEADDGSSGGEADHPAPGAGSASMGSSSLLPKPLLTDVPIALEPSTTLKRGSGSGSSSQRRYEPYEATSPTTAKRRRGKQGSLGGGPTSPGSDPTQSPQSPHSATLEAPGDDATSPYGYPASYYTPYPAPGPYTYSSAYSTTPQQIPYGSFADGGPSSSSSNPPTGAYSYYPPPSSSPTAGGYTGGYSWSPAYPSAYNPGATGGSVYPSSTTNLSAPRAIREGNDDARRA